MLSILGVPYAGVLALWVAFADLIPLVGATLGAVPTIGVRLPRTRSPAGVATLIFFIAYQQFENHVLQVTVMCRTVNVNPLTCSSASSSPSSCSASSAPCSPSRAPA